MLTLWTAVVPVVRAFLRGEVSYNEGWNIYAAQVVARDGVLYPAKYEWMTVNYPMSSFALLAGLHRFTQDYLFTARAVSLFALVACGVVVGWCVRLLGAGRRAAWLAGLFCVAVFCAAQNAYVGVDDPQILSNAVFLLGFAIYLRSRRSMGALALSALVFAVAVSIKHSPVEFLLAVFVDLALSSLPLALWFMACFAGLGGVSFALHLRYGGPGFLLQLFAPRAYSAASIVDRIRDVIGPLLVPFVLAAAMAYLCRRDGRRRVLTMLLTLSLVIGSYFAGGHGVANNCLFGALFAMCMLLGLLWGDAGPLATWTLRSFVAPLLFLWLLIPMALNDQLNTRAALRDAVRNSENLLHQAAVLRGRPGPALCESLLVCYQAGKPLVCDPFNATRLMNKGKLDPGVLIDQLRRGSYSSVQFTESVDKAEAYERFPPAVLDALRENYEPLAVSLSSGTIYVPKRDVAGH